MTISDYLEAALLNAVFNQTSFSVAVEPWVSLHDADPTDITATAWANEIDAGANTYVRKQTTWDTAAGTGGIVDNDAQIQWVDMPECKAGGANEQLGWVAIFDVITDGAGNLLWSGALTVAKDVNAGDTFTIAAGALDVTLA